MDSDRIYVVILPPDSEYDDAWLFYTKDEAAAEELRSIFGRKHIDHDYILFDSNKQIQSVEEALLVWRDM